MKESVTLPMEGTTTKYYHYKERGSGNITIPVRIAEALNWNHKEELSLTLEAKEGVIALVIKKKNIEND